MADCESSDDEGNAGENDSDSQRCTSDVGAVGLSKNTKRKRKDPGNAKERKRKRKASTTIGLNLVSPL